MLYKHTVHTRVHLHAIIECVYVVDHDCKVMRGTLP